jgi:hypothetical protein
VRVGNYIPFLRDHGVELQYRSTLTDREYALLTSPAHPLRKAAVLTQSAGRAFALRTGESMLLIHRLLTLTPVPLVDPPCIRL